MKKIQSFTIDHEKLLPGIYVSRKDESPSTGEIVTTFDLRFVAPNREPAIDSKASHTIEHLGATYLRNSDLGKADIYFGPMGCLTGFYFVLFGDLEPEDIYEEILRMLDFIIDFEGEIPGAKPKECGNYSFHDLEKAKVAAKKYKEDLKNKNFVYPE